MVEGKPVDGSRFLVRARTPEGVREQGFFGSAFRRVELVTALAVLVALVVAVELHAASAHTSRVDTLRDRAHALVRKVEQAKTTLVFFEHHARLLYSTTPRVKRRAWHDVGVARRRVVVGRRDLRWTRKE